MYRKSIDNRFRSSSQRQKGVIATLIAVIVLVATLLAAVALMRSLDTSNTIAGSLAFRQSVIQEAARAYVDAKRTGNINYTEPASETDQGSNGVGYYGGLMPSAIASKGIPDVLVAQATNASATPSPGIFSLPVITGANTSTTNNNVYYVVERLCPRSSVGSAADPTLCSVPGATITGGSSSNQTTDTGAPFNSGSNAGFRLSVLVMGPKNTIGYIQTVLR